MEREVRKVLEAHFKPEFLNRVDEVIIFRPLGKEAILRIVGLQLELLATSAWPTARSGSRSGQEAKELLAERGFDPVYGARPLKRTIQQDVQNPLAMKILAGEYGEGDTVAVGVDKAGEIAFGKK